MEQRKYQRTPILLPARIIPSEKHSLEKHSHQGRITNYSQQGLYLDIAVSDDTHQTASHHVQAEASLYQPGDELTLSFTMPQLSENKIKNQKEQILASTTYKQPQVVKIQAKVVRCHQHGLGLQRLPSQPWPYDSLQTAANILQQHLKEVPPSQPRPLPKTERRPQTVSTAKQPSPPPLLGEDLEADHFNRFARLSKAIKVRHTHDQPSPSQNTSTPAQSYLSETLETLVLKELGNFDGFESHQDVIQYLIDDWQQKHPQQKLPDELQWQLKVIQIFFSQLNLNVQTLEKNATPYAWLKKNRVNAYSILLPA